VHSAVYLDREVERLEELGARADAVATGDLVRFPHYAKELSMDAMKGRAYRLMFSAASLVTLAVTTGAARKFT
jgi:hypothetical protein